MGHEKRPGEGVLPAPRLPHGRGMSSAWIRTEVGVPWLLGPLLMRQPDPIYALGSLQSAGQPPGPGEGGVIAQGGDSGAGQAGGPQWVSDGPSPHWDWVCKRRKMSVSLSAPRGAWPLPTALWGWEWKGKRSLDHTENRGTADTCSVTLPVRRTAPVAAGEPPRGSRVGGQC